MGAGSTKDAVEVLKLQPEIIHIFAESDKIGVSTRSLKQADVESILKDLAPQGSRHRIHDEGGHFVRERIKNKLKELDIAD